MLTINDNKKLCDYCIRFDTYVSKRIDNKTIQLKNWEIITNKLENYDS